MNYKKILSAAAAAVIAVQTTAVLAEGMFFENIPVKKVELDEVTSYFKLERTENENGGMVSYKWTDENGDEMEKASISLLDASKDDLPKQYSSVDAGYITSVKNQGRDGCCWAFASIGAAEANMLKKGYANNPDYSEEHLAYFASNSLSERYGDGMKSENPYGGGGNSRMVAALLSAWGGVELEANFPYGDGLNQAERVYDESDRYNSYAHMENYYSYEYDEMDAIKSAIMNYGSATYEYYSGEAEFHKNGYTTYYNSDAGKTIDHEVLIVGWDDDFDKENFSQAPQSNGAWLAKNSWGTAWGDGGYFWISYENMADGGKVSAFDMEKTDDYDNNYLYDGNGYDILIPGMYSYANTFTAKGNEAVKAVSGFIPSECDMTVLVYKCDGSQLNLHSEYSASSIKTQHADSEGFYTVKLDDPVNVREGEVFTVVISLSSEYAPVENKTNSYGAQYTSNEGESYICWPAGDDYIWIDVADAPMSGNTVLGNVSARALTTDGFAEENYEFDINSLGDIIDDAKSLDKENYDDEEWNNMLSMLSIAENVYNVASDYANGIINRTAKSLKESLEAMTSKYAYTKEEIKVIVSAFEEAGFNKEEYTPSSWAQLSSALSAAENVPENASNYELEALALKVANAMMNLKKVEYIETPQDLAQLSNKKLPDDTVAVLKNDIIFDKKKANSFTPIQNFTGTLDGNGHVISGININNSGLTNSGLFDIIPVGTVIKNLGVVDSVFNGGMYVGGIAGICYGEIYNCYAIADTVVSAKEGYGCPLVGVAAGRSIIKNSYGTGSVGGAGNSNTDDFALMPGTIDITTDKVYYYDADKKIARSFIIENNVIYTNETENCSSQTLSDMLNTDRGQNKVWFVSVNDYLAMTTGEEGLYIKDGVLLAYSGDASLLRIPADVYKIGEGVFENNTTVTKIKFLGNAPEISRKSFKNCAANIAYYEGAKGFNSVSWTLMNSMAEPDIQYEISSEANNEGYNIKISPLISRADDANVLMAQYSSDGRFESLRRMPLSEMEFSKTDGAYTMHANNVTSDKCNLMLWDETGVPSAVKHNIK